ncbi:DUF3180 family protein [Naumannella halotolerans]|uniref:DUF3180 family protein n=1 Tax=Naumannella halotolerans TaxID=993414 RepID=UPI00370D1CE0
MYLVAAAAVGAVGAWALASLVELLSGLPLQLTWPGAVVLLVIGGCISAIAAGAWLRLRRDRVRTEPARAVALLALGKAAALGGALMAGGYLMFAMLSVPDLAVPAARDRVLRASVAMIGGLIVMVAGLVLERACRVPEDGDDDAEDDQPDL